MDASPSNTEQAYQRGWDDGYHFARKWIWVATIGSFAIAFIVGVAT